MSDNVYQDACLHHHAWLAAAAKITEVGERAIGEDTPLATAYLAVGYLAAFVAQAYADIYYGKIKLEQPTP